MTGTPPAKLTSGVQLDVVASISGDGESILLGLQPQVNSDVQLVTFATVLFSANRVSHLNIVSAIRDLPEPPRPPSYLKDRLLAPLRAVADGFRALYRLRVFRAVRHWLIGLPGSLLRLVWLGFTSGPFTLLLGLFLTQIGFQYTNAAAYSSGVSFVIIGGGVSKL